MKAGEIFAALALTGIAVYVGVRLYRDWKKSQQEKYPV